ncbi:MAG: exosortase-associated protein EpsI, B-type [Betaproteobacteria bacterium]
MAALTRPVRQALAMVVAMVLVALLAQAGKPVHKLAEQRPRFDLEQVVPERFGDWRLLRAGGVVLPDPSVLANIKRLYTQTLSRAYVNSRGTVVMLSIAYGDDQRAAMAVHYPEVCYPAQGFQVRSNRIDSVATPHGTLPVRRLETELSRQRYEPVTYWVTIGDRISLGGLERRLIELEYGLQRVIPDGLLFRVSSINRDSAQGFRDQDAFTRDLLATLPAVSREWLAGDPARLAAQPQP